MPAKTVPLDARRGRRPSAHRRQPPPTASAPGVARRSLARPGIGARVGEPAREPDAGGAGCHRAGAAADHDEDRRQPDRGGDGDPCRRRHRPAERPGTHHAGRGSARWSGCGPARTPSCCGASPNSTPMSNGTQPSWCGCSSTSWRSREAARARGRAPDFPRHLGPQLPALLHRAGDLGVGHLDADGGAGLPHPLPATRHRCRRRNRHQPAVPADVAAGAVRRPDRRPARQAQGALRHPGDGGHPRTDPGHAGRDATR